MNLRQDASLVQPHSRLIGTNYHSLPRLAEKSYADQCIALSPLWLPIGTIHTVTQSRVRFFVSPTTFPLGSQPPYSERHAVVHSHLPLLWVRNSCVQVTLQYLCERSVADMATCTPFSTIESTVAPRSRRRTLALGTPSFHLHSLTSPNSFT